MRYYLNINGIIMKSGINYNNIVFDLGNVLVELDSQDCMKAFEKLGVLPYLAPSLHPEGRQLMRNLGLGLLSTKDFCEEVRRMTGLSITDRQIESAANMMLTSIPYQKKELLLSLKAQGKRLFLLSNTIDMHWEYCVERLFPYHGYNVNDFFENVFLSQRMHLEKPDPKIFLEVERIAGLQPNETLYIDDLEENCQAAKTSVGWQVFQNKGIDDWLSLF